jgi:hypothetical protein
MNKEEKQALKKVMNNCSCLNCQYKKAYNILMDYWDSLPDEEKPLIDKKLKRLNL